MILYIADRFLSKESALKDDQNLDLASSSTHWHLTDCQAVDWTAVNVKLKFGWIVTSLLDFPESLTVLHTSETRRRFRLIFPNQLVSCNPTWKR